MVPKGMAVRAALVALLGVMGPVVLHVLGQTVARPTRVQWKHISSANGDLPVPGESRERCSGCRSGPRRGERFCLELSREGSGAGLVPALGPGLGPLRHREGVLDRRGGRSGLRYRWRRVPGPRLWGGLPGRSALVVAQPRRALRSGRLVGTAHYQEGRRASAPRPDLRGFQRDG